MMRSVDKFFLYLRTIYYLKPIQIRYRIYYFLKKKVEQFLDVNGKVLQPKKIFRFLALSNLPQVNTSYVGNQSFTFLNLNHEFKKSIDWNNHQYGKLWTYNLCYFDYLLQDSISKEEALSLMEDFASNYKHVSDGLEPYPTSIRLINWIKFVSINQEKNDLINQIIYSDLIRLSKNIEYQLMGNHLLENAFALFIGGIYFQENKIVEISTKILENELNEQVLIDGAHFELSPMYHQILLFKVLDCLNVVVNNSQFTIEKMEHILFEKAQLMLTWLNNMSGQNGVLPAVNDCTNNFSFSLNKLNNYAGRLGVNQLKLALKESGYRRFDYVNYSALVDVGNIGPDYIPGHAHSDTFNFVLSIDDHSVFVDTGISTYEKNDIRQLERSTKSHNTVEINGIDQSEIWDGFRVGRRAKSVVIDEGKNFITAAHNGYENLGIIHTRTFSFEDDEIVIQDSLNERSNAIAYFHFHPDLIVSVINNIVDFEIGCIHFQDHIKIDLEVYQFALDFNHKQSARVIAVSFNQKLQSKIKLGGAN